ncbi:hypothetical protein KIL84_005228 [Mauremys mutica]|uniref:Uncharacterized protein n=1 Tax=Mauremys mutica TaxID=74926 RepID=A0A9D3XKT1_9SAUR|nr:hypothetical protein KIL84_005228 [Mauremys mutica]
MKNGPSKIHGVWKYRYRSEYLVTSFAADGSDNPGNLAPTTYNSAVSKQFQLAGSSGQRLFSSWVPEKLNISPQHILQFTLAHCLAEESVWSPKERDAVDKEILHLAGLNYSQPSSITCPNIARFSRVQHPVHWAHLKICPLILVPNLSRALSKICLIQNPLRSMGVLNWHQWAMIPLLLWGKKRIRSKGGHSHTLHLLSCDGHEDFVHCCHPILKTLRGS